MVFKNNPFNMQTREKSRKECQSEAREVIQKLEKLRENYDRQLSVIINSYRDDIDHGIGEIAEEISCLTAELSDMKKERKVLLETVDNLNGEIRQLNAKLQPLPDLKNEIKLGVQDLDNNFIGVMESTQDFFNNSPKENVAHFLSWGHRNILLP